MTTGKGKCIIHTVFGLVAQLGAHHIRIVGVGSSNLLKSTKEKHHSIGVVFLFGMAFTKRRFELLFASVQWTLAATSANTGGN